jgi:dUTP pyrophosphatase|nr:MAG TPA: deoxyuridine 5'-triphosphate nucleotidohydrolase [Caudoviricetes sp.]
MGQTINAIRKQHGLKPIVKRVRGFEVVSRMETPVKLPTRGSIHSAGYDIYAYNNYEIKPKQSVLIRTGVKAYMPYDEYLDLRVRSSLGIKRQLMLATGASVIDSDYYNNEENEGEIMVVLYNYGDETQTIAAGERIVQGIFTKYFLIDNDDTTKERTGGTGSTNK